MREKLEQKNETEATEELQDLLDQQIAGGTPIPLGKGGGEVKISLPPKEAHAPIRKTQISFLPKAVRKA